MQRFMTYLELVRFPAVFTALADIFLGFLFTHAGFQPDTDFGLLLLASGGLYLAGMVFNDVFDREVDAEQRPFRPIPSGRVSVYAASVLGSLLACGGVCAAGIVGERSLTVALLLALFIVAYDGGLKRTWLGPIAMGVCRFLNVILGASAAAGDAVVWGPPQLPVAAGLGIYVAGITWFARREAARNRRNELRAATGVINAGLAVLAAFVLDWAGQNRTLVLIMLGVILLTINRRLMAALCEPCGERVQRAITLLLLSLITLDATLVLYVNGHVESAMATAALLIPSAVLGRWLRIT